MALARSMSAASLGSGERDTGDMGSHMGSSWQLNRSHPSGLRPLAWLPIAASAACQPDDTGNLPFSWVYAQLHATDKPW